MHRMETSPGTRLARVAAVAALLTAVAAFATPVDAAGPFPNVNNSAALAQFIIPGTPLTRTSAAVTAGAAAPFTLTVNSTAGFPTSGQILVSDGAWGDGDKDNAEIMTYAGLTGGFQVTERGATKIPGSTNKAHASGSKVKLATTTSASLAAATGPQTTLLTDITNTMGGCATRLTCPVGNLTTPFPITLGSTAGFPASGEISISHQDLQTSNLADVQIAGGTMASEMFGYDSSCGGAGQICIIQRAQQATNEAYAHRATAFPQPNAMSGVSKVSLHFMLPVKANAGFFPSGNLMICDATNPLTNCELLGHNNAGTKVATPSATEFRITGRGAATATFDKTPITLHGSGSIVTGADAFLTCRNGTKQPGVDTDLVTPGFQEPGAQMAGTSVGLTAACYTQTQPDNGSKPSCCPPAGGDIAGQDLVVMNSIAGQPFLSTGCFTHVVLGAVPCVDTNGATDGTLGLVSPCIINFTPGTNLQVTVSLAADKTLENTDTGTITVVLDAIHDQTAGNGDECDDPSGTDNFTSTTYDSPGSAENADDDTDNDGCLDWTEMLSARALGGVRDPWNPYDYYDIDHDGGINVVVDILQVAAAFGPGDPDYLPRKDRGSLNYGPFAWNKSAPNGSVDVVGDILGVATQFGDACPHNHALYVGGKAPWYGAGVVPGH